VYNHYNRSQGIAVYREYREVVADIDDLIYFSSLGPAMSAILKPEVVAPGAGIVSARALENAGPNHDIDPFDGMIMDGTSMACPNVAGSAALVTEYLQKYHNLNASSSLIKAVIIGSADLPYDEEPEPDVEYGFGVVNLGRHLPFNKTTFKLLVADRVLIKDQTHLRATVNVISPDTELRITISFIDAVTAYDGYTPLFGELALIVESPSGQLYRGNQHPRNGEEHFSTHQRVIIFPNVEIGSWTIHIIANLVPDLLDEVEFSAVVRGSIDNNLLNFIQTTSCVGCPGICDTSNGLCNCGNESLGQSCQFPIQNFSIISEKRFQIPSSGNAYLSFVPPSKDRGILTVSIDIIDLYSWWLYPIIHVYISEDRGPSAFPRDYDIISWGVDTYVQQFLFDGSDSQIKGILIHNPLWWNATYELTTTWVSILTKSPNPTRTGSQANSSQALIIGLAVGIPVVISIILAVGVVCFHKRRRREVASEQMDQELMASDTEKGAH
jgi:hypothetical protein